MEDIKYHPLVDRDTEEMDKVPMFFSGSEATIRENHDMYLEEMVPKHYRLCSVNGTAPKIADGFTIHCPYCGKAMRCIAKSDDIHRLGLYNCPDCSKKEREEFDYE